MYDVTVIGSGPGGYVAAIRCAQLGMKTALIERYPTLGGTCLNVGCIPSKALLDSSEHYHQALTNFGSHGIEVSGLTLHFDRMIERKNAVIRQTCDGISFLMGKNKIDVIHGHGSFITPNTLQITQSNGVTQSISSRNVIIATGSKPSSLPNIPIDKQRIITSTEALSLKELPKTMAIIGGGVIGLELGSVYARLGTKVQVIEFMDSLIPTMDRALGKELQRSLKKMGVEFLMKHAVQQAENQGSQVLLKIQNPKKELIELTVDYCLVAVGRRPYTDQLGLSSIGIALDERGRIPVDAHLQTVVPGIYAIGDVIQGAMLAHKAEEEGIFVAECLAGQKPHINYLMIPNVVYTWPEVAGVGLTEEQLQQQNHSYKVGSFPFKALGRARAAQETDGFVKVLADAQTDEILGIHIIGPRAADLIGEAVVAMEFRASAEDISRMSHAHPTFSEAIKEACLAATENRPIHL